MRNDIRPSRITLWPKLTLAHALVTLAATLTAEMVALAGLALIFGRRAFTLPDWTWHIALVAAFALLVGTLLGVWISRRLTRRLRRVLEISRAWTRGNLSLRISDPSGDEVGLLAGQLDLLVEHVEKDEEDLAELRERNARLTDQVRALAVVEERNRLARELHDSVKQHLFSLGMTASAIRARFDALRNAPPELAEMILEIETNAQAAQQEMTRLIEDLKPASLQTQGLAHVLNDYTLLFGAREHILAYLDVQGNDALLPLPVSEALYRVAQEALRNVARHARATRVDVCLRCIPEQAVLIIKDNGVGFDINQPQRGLGLANMQERMMEIGGVLTVESQPGVGTVVTAEVGLSPAVSPEIARFDKDRPAPTIENWPWLGQRLTIPVGQTWPWLPADQFYLRRPLVETRDEPLTINRDVGILGRQRVYILQLGKRQPPLLRIRRGRSQYTWKDQGASWALRRLRGPSGQMVLMRNGQPLAAMQYQGRLLNTWSEIIYDDHGYRLACNRERPGHYVLSDETGSELAAIEIGVVSTITLQRALPLPLLVMAAMRAMQESQAVERS